MATDLSTFNKFGVGAMIGSDEIVLLKPVPQRMTRDDAIILAAYLVSVADLDGTRFNDYLEELLNA